MKKNQWIPSLRKISAGLPLALIALLSVFSMALIGPQAPDAATVYVDDDLVCGGQTPCYATIQEGVALVDANGLVIVSPGTYYVTVSNPINVTKAMTIRGAHYLDDPRPNGHAERAGESIVRPGDDLNPIFGNLFTVSADNVTIEGFYLDGTNTTTMACPADYPSKSNGVCLFAAGAVANGDYDRDPPDSPTPGFEYNISNLTVRNNIIVNFNLYGVTVGSKTLAARNGHLITQNVFNNMESFAPTSIFPTGLEPWGVRRAISMRENQFGSIQNNKATNVMVGIEMGHFTQPSPGGLFEVKANDLSAIREGIWTGQFFSGSVALTISNNILRTDSGTSLIGIHIETVRDPAQITISGNTVEAGAHIGIRLYSLTTTSGVVVQDTTITSPLSYGVVVLNQPSGDAVVGQALVTLNNVDISAPPVGISVQDQPGAPVGNTIAVTVSNGSSITGATTAGLVVSGPDATATVTASSFTGNELGLQSTNGALLSVSNSIVTGNNTHGIQVGMGTPAGRAGAISINDLSGNTGRGVDNASATVVNASSNWWGSAVPITVLGEVSTGVDFTPWFNYADADTNPANGFQGDFSWLWVDDTSPNTNVTWIGEGLGLVSAAGRVTVVAGSYAESVALNQNAILAPEAGVTLSGAVSQAQGTILAPAGTLTFQGNFTRTGGTFTHSSGTVALSGAALQTLGGSATTIFHHLTLGNAAGVQLGGPVQVMGVLTLNGTVFDLGAYNLDLGPSSTVGGAALSATNLVVADSGSLCKQFSGAGAFTFPIGDNTGAVNYTPAQATLTGGSYTSGSLCVKVTDGHYTPNTAVNRLSRYWSVSSSGISGFSAAFTFSYASDAEDVTGMETAMKALMFENNAYPPTKVGASVNAAANTFALNDVASLPAVFTAGNDVSPVTLTSVMVSRLSGTSNNITWTATGESSVATVEYRVYRTLSIDGAETLVGTKQVGAQPYSLNDTTIPPFTTVYYWILVDVPGDSDHRFGPFTLLWVRMQLPIMIR